MKQWAPSEDIVPRSPTESETGVLRLRDVGCERTILIALWILIVWTAWRVAVFALQISYNVRFAEKRTVRPNTTECGSREGSRHQVYLLAPCEPKTNALQPNEPEPATLEIANDRRTAE